MPVINLALSVIFVGPGLSLTGSTLAVGLGAASSIVAASDGSLALSGDVLSPGASRVYGTNAGGIKGWYVGGGGGGATPGGNPGDIQFNDSGAFGGIAPPTGALVGTTATQTLTGKTIDGGSNTLANIANGSLQHATYQVGNGLTSLGGSISLDGMSSLATVGLIKRSAANTWVIAIAGTDYAAVSSLAPTFVALTPGSTVTWAVVAGQTVQNATLAMGGNYGLTFSGLASGMTGVLVATQDATGGRTLALPPGSKVVNGGTGAVTLTAAANAIDILTWVYDGVHILWTFGPNFT